MFHRDVATASRSGALLMFPLFVLLVQTGCGLCYDVYFDQTWIGGGSASISAGDATSADAFEVSGLDIDAVRLRPEGLPDRASGAVLYQDSAVGYAWLDVAQVDLEGFEPCGVPVRDAAIQLYWYDEGLTDVRVTFDGIEMTDQDFPDPGVVIVGPPPIPGVAGGGTVAMAMASCAQSTLFLEVDWRLNPVVGAHDEGSYRSCSTSIWN